MDEDDSKSPWKCAFKANAHNIDENMNEFSSDTYKPGHGKAQPFIAIPSSKQF